MIEYVSQCLVNQTRMAPLVVLTSNLVLATSSKSAGIWQTPCCRRRCRRLDAGGRVLVYQVCTAQLIRPNPRPSSQTQGTCCTTANTFVLGEMLYPAPLHPANIQSRGSRGYILARFGIRHRNWACTRRYSGCYKRERAMCSLRGRQCCSARYLTIEKMMILRP